VKVQGSQVIPGATERVYDLLLDPAVLAACMPGCQELIRVEDGIYKMKMKLAIAALSGDFSGTVRISEAVRPVAFQMTIDGAGRIGHMRADGRIQLAGVGDSTSVNYEGDVQVGGTIATVGQRLIDATSKMIIRNFFSNFALQMAARYSVFFDP
jgi:carbon monoxide dehydrogenase subunit G